jgi:hypothetical protein
VSSTARPLSERRKAAISWRRLSPGTLLTLTWYCTCTVECGLRPAHGAGLQVEMSVSNAHRPAGLHPNSQLPTPSHRDTRSEPRHSVQSEWTAGRFGVERTAQGWLCSPHSACRILCISSAVSSDCVLLPRVSRTGWRHPFSAFVSLCRRLQPCPGICFIWPIAPWNLGQLYPARVCLTLGAATVHRNICHCAGFCPEPAISGLSVCLMCQATNTEYFSIQDRRPNKLASAAARSTRLAYLTVNKPPGPRSRPPTASLQARPREFAFDWEREGCHGLCPLRVPTPALCSRTQPQPPCWKAGTPPPPCSPNVYLPCSRL